MDKLISLSDSMYATRLHLRRSAEGEIASDCVPRTVVLFAADVGVVGLTETTDVPADNSDVGGSVNVPGIGLEVVTSMQNFMLSEPERKRVDNWTVSHRLRSGSERTMQASRQLDYVPSLALGF